jgi:hypothetical protein
MTGNERDEEDAREEGGESLLQTEDAIRELLTVLWCSTLLLVVDATGKRRNEMRRRGRRGRVEGRTGNCAGGWSECRMDY